MEKIRGLFNGKKTYLAAAVGVIVTGLYSMGYIDSSVYDTLVAIAGFLGLGFLRTSVK